ncbi:MAG: dTDP-glucose 4,6-dehydratase [Nanoarchaeota archaeon]
MKILVTGGAGFIGSNYIRLVLSEHEDIKVVNLDKLTYAGNPDNLKDIASDQRYTFVKGDICDADIVEQAMRGCGQVVNFAAETHVDRSITGPGPFIKTDVLGTFTLLEAARKLDVKRYVQVSTDEVYGSILEGSFKETDRLDPNSPYSASKAGGDMIVRSYHETYGVPTLITRSSNNYGPYQYPEKVWPRFITNLIQGKKVPLYGDGKNVRDWIHVDDNCKGIETVRKSGKVGEIYNIGAKNELTNIEVTKMLLAIMGKDEHSIEWVKDRLGHDRRYSLDITRISALGWKPEHDFASGLKHTVQWYQDNEAWWRKLL